MSTDPLTSDNQTMAADLIKEYSIQEAGEETVSNSKIRLLARQGFEEKDQPIL